MSFVCLISQVGGGLRIALLDLDAFFHPFLGILLQSQDYSLQLITLNVLPTRLCSLLLLLEGTKTSIGFENLFLELYF